MIVEIFIDCSREGSILNHGFEGRAGFTACRKKWFDEDDGFQNSPLGVESRRKGGCSMGGGGRGRIKENEKDTRTN